MNLYLVLMIGIIIFVFLFYKIFLIINYKFWAYQPVFHKINLLYYIFPNHIINNELPKITRYCNFKDIKINNIFTISDTEVDEIIKFLIENFTQNKNDIFNLNNKKFMANFQGNKDTNYVGRYFKKDYNLIDNKFKICNKLTGIITTRNLNMTINKEKLKICYADNLCVDKNFRKKNIAASLIKTVEYKIRENNKNILIFLFKKEGILDGIVPLSKFKIFQFDIQNINKLYNNSIHFYKLKNENFIDLINFFTKKRDLFKLWILPDLSNFQNLINLDIYQIYVKCDVNKNIENLYIFQDTNIIYKGNKSIELISSIITNINDIDIEIGMLLNNINKLDYKFLNINSISNNLIILEKIMNIIKKYDYEVDCAYYIYNYKINTINSKDVFILI